MEQSSVYSTATPSISSTIKPRTNKNLRRKFRCTESMIVVPTEAGSYTFPGSLPKVSTTVTISVGMHQSLLILELDKCAILQSVCVYCEPKHELLRLVYDRVLIVESLEQLGIQMVNNGYPPVKDTDGCQYEVTTHIEHSFKFSAKDFYLTSARVKQNGRTILINVAHRAHRNSL
ncbi:hypothetical protein AHF37_06764 [Paragonimus kellicotti]|nr:hypothetical protein AHF37_06764 [Paragonimus kellicotti]